MLHSFKFSFKKAFIIVSVTVVYIICLILSMHLKLDEKITSMLPASDAYTSDFNFIIDNIPATEVIYIDIENLSDNNDDHLKRASDFVFDKLHKSPYFIDIVYKFSQETFFDLINLLSREKFSLLNEDDIQKIEQSLTPSSIDKKLLNIKRNLLKPSAFFLKERVIKDPLGFDELIFAKLETLKNETAGIKIDGGRITSKDGRHVLIIATPFFSAVDTKQSKKMIDFLESLRNEVNHDFKGSIRAGFAGNHIATYDNSTSIQKDVKRAVVILSVGIVVIGTLFFRRKIFVLLIFLPTIISLTIASAFLSLITSSVSAIALGCGSVLVGITVDFGIHILFSIDNSSGNDFSSIIKKLRTPIATGALTTITAFSCLLLSSLPGQRQMGLFALIGVFCAACFSVFILENFIPRTKIGKNKPAISLISICEKFIRFRNRYSIHFLCFCIALFVISLFGLKNFKFEGDVSKLNHLTPIVKRDTDNFLKTWGGSSPAIVLVQAFNFENALEKNDQLFLLLHTMQQQGNIDNVSSLSPIIPSEFTQKKNNQNWINYMSDSKQRSIREMVTKASSELGFSENVFNPFFDSLKGKTKGLYINDFNETAINKLIKGKIIKKENNILVMTTFEIKDRSKVNHIRSKIKSEIQGSMFLDKKSFVKNTANLVSSEFKKLLYFAIIGMIVSLSIFIRRLKVVFITIMPVFFSVVITAGILGFINIAVNLISMLFIVFVFGVGVDFSIFLINKELLCCNEESRQEIAVTEGAVFLCALTTIGAFISLMFADHAALISIGAAGFTGMLTSLVLSVILIPILAKKFLF